MTGIMCWSKARRWVVAAVIIVFGGYAIGKDMALRDNARDLSVASEAEQ